MNADLDVRHLQALVALAEEGTFTDAAIRLGVTQSAVSRTIAGLEREVGVQLVHRTTRAVELTAAGTRCYRAAVQALAAVGDVVEAAHDQARPLRLGYAWSALGRHTSEVLRRWRSTNPDVPLEVHRVDDLDAGLTRGRTDVAVVRGDVRLAGVASRLVFREPRMAALPSAHPLTGAAAVTLADLREETVLTTSYGTTTLSLWPEAVRPSRSLHVDNTDEWLTEIAGGLGVGVTAESTASQHAHPGVAFVPMPSAGAVDVHLAWPERRVHPSVAAFCDLVAQVVELSRPSDAGAG